MGPGYRDRIYMYIWQLVYTSTAWLLLIEFHRLELGTWMFFSRGVCCVCVCVYVSLSLGYAYVLFVCLVSKLTFSERRKYVSFFVFLPAPCTWPDLRTLREGRSDAHLSLSPSLHFLFSADYGVWDKLPFK